MPATGEEIGTPASMRARVLPQTLAMELEPLDDHGLADHADGVRELVGAGRTGSSARSARAPWPISRRPGPRIGPHFADRIGREVVVVHVALGFVRRERVELLGHAQAAERGDAEDLRLAALEEARCRGCAGGRRRGCRGRGSRWSSRPSARLPCSRICLRIAFLMTLLSASPSSVRLELLAELLGELLADRLVRVAALAGGVGDEFVDAVLEVVADLVVGVAVVRARA